MNYSKFIPNEVTVENIIKETSKLWNVREEEMINKGRTQPLAFARQVAMFLTYELTGLSTIKVGKAFGNRDRSTVYYATQKIEQAIHQSPQIKTAVEQLRLRLQRIPVK